MNKACRIRGDHWHAASSDDWEVENPSVADLDRVLERLDAAAYSLVSVYAEDPAHLTVGGGAGRYVVYATFDKDEFWNLISDAPEGGVVLLTAGGQEGDFPSRQVVNWEQARAAARAFFLGRCLDPEQRWERQ